MIVIYAEKFDVGIKIAASLSGGFEVDGLQITMRNIESCKQKVQKKLKDRGFISLRLESGEYCITWGQGHMCELKQAADYDRQYANWNNLPVPFFPKEYEIKIKEGRDYNTGKKTGAPDAYCERQLDIVGDLFDRCEYIINATDDDREGELIFAYVYQYLKCSKPYKRVLLDSQTEEGFKKAFANLVDSSKVKNIESAGRCRSAADWITGANMSAQMSLKFGRYFPDLPVITIGRIQTVVLDFIVEREKAIRAFKSVPYWYVTAEFNSENGGVYTGRHSADKILNRTEAEELMKKISGKKGVVESVDTKDVKREVPLLMNLPDLSRAANDAIGLTAKQTLEVAQKLYESGLITYPRTESQCLTDDMKDQVDEVLDMLAEYSEQYKGWIEAVDRAKRAHGRRHYNSAKVESHFAIIPTNQKPGSLAGHEARLYDLIARSLIRTIYGPAIEQKTTLITDVAGEKFKTTGTMVKDPQWLALEMKERKNEDRIPLIAIGDDVKGTYERKESKTEPPKRYTDATLLLAMQTASKAIDDEALKEVLKEANQGGIGRPSTQGPTIEKVVSTYCTRSGKQIVPSEAAIRLIEVLPVPDLKSPEMTARWEQKLDEVAKGKMEMKDFIAQSEEDVRKWVEQVVSDTTKMEVIGGSAARNMTCPKCGRPMRKTKYGWLCEDYKKDGTGCTFAVSLVIASKSIDDEQIEKLIATGKTDWLTGFCKKDSGEKFGSYLALNQDKKVVFSRESGIACPVCGKALQKLDKGYVCGTKEGGCGFAAWSEVAGKRLTDRQMVTLLTKKKTGVIKGFKKKDGSTFECALCIDENTKRVTFDTPKPEKTAWTCPKCGEAMYKSDKMVYCRNAECGMRLYRTVAGVTIPDRQIEKLLKGEVTDEISGFTSKRNTQFSAKLALSEGKMKYVFPERAEPVVVEGASCPQCGGAVYKGPKSWFCADKEDCGFQVWQTYGGVELTDEQMKRLFKGEKTETVHGICFPDGSPFDGVLHLGERKNGTYGIVCERASDENLRCLKCGAPMVRSDKVWTCTGCDFKLWRKQMGKELTDRQMETLLVKGETGLIRGFCSKKTGKTYDAHLYWDGEQNGGSIQLRFPKNGKDKK